MASSAVQDSDPSTVRPIDELDPSDRRASSATTDSTTLLQNEVGPPKAPTAPNGHIHQENTSSSVGSSSSQSSPQNENPPSRTSSLSAPPLDPEAMALELSLLRDQNTKLWALVKRQHTAIQDLQQDLDDMVKLNQQLKLQTRFDQMSSLSHNAKSISGTHSASHSRSPSATSNYSENTPSCSAPADTAPVSVSASAEKISNPTDKNTNNSADASSGPVTSPPERKHKPPPLNLSPKRISLTSSTRRRSQIMDTTRRSSLNPHLDLPDSPYAVVTSEKDGSAISLDPSLLDSMTVSVYSALLGKVGASLRPNGKEDPVAMLSVNDRPSGKEMWRLVKDYSQLAALDYAVRVSGGCVGLPKLPDRSMFTSQVPSKVDLRKNTLNQYFAALMTIPSLPEPAAASLCTFLASNIIGVPPSTSFNKVGFLTKRGRRMRTWKTRFFVLNGPYLDYFDQPEGQHLGTIMVFGARIGKPRQSDQDTNSNNNNSDEDYRHAFLIMERKKNSSSYIRHILCAESDEDRDKWVSALLEYVDVDPICPLPANKPPAPNTTESTNDESVSDDNSTIATAKRPSVAISSPMDGQIITQVDWQRIVQKNTSQVEPPVQPQPQTNEERRKLFSFKFRSDESALPPTLPTPAELLASPFTMSTTPTTQTPTISTNSPFNLASPINSSATSSGTTTAANLSALLSSYDPLTPPPSSTTADNQVFGCPLTSVVLLSSKVMDGCTVPTILYRCIELLDYKKAWYEEGIFRLSGSSSVIRELTTTFNRDYDIDLVKMDADVHAVTGLLKRFLREIPTPAIPAQMNADFSRALETEDLTSRCAKVRDLVLQLPKEHKDLLQVLCGFLLKIVANVDLNKMNVKNLSIVFSPTLHISTGIFITFLENYRTIFLD